MSDDANEIYAEIEKRKRRAQELGVSELIWDLFGNVEHLPSYSRNDPSGYKKFVPDFVTSIEQPEKGIVTFVYDGVKYSFSWTTKSVESFSAPNYEIARDDGRLVLCVGDDRVFELTLRGQQDMSSDEYVPPTWIFREIEAFIEGPWVNILREVNNKIIQHRRAVHEADAKKRREDPAKLANLKDRFGIK